MGIIIAVVGNTGVGKTTFARALCQAGGFTPALEQHIERPFQALFAQDLTRYALANQVDYLLLRAEQERALRAQAGVGVMDGGLELDFYAFTRLFHRKGYLSQAEFELCERLYRSLRASLPPPELTTWLHADSQTIIERYRQRQRPLQIAQAEDIRHLDELIADWMASETPPNLLKVDASLDDASYHATLKQVLVRIKPLLMA